MCGLALCVLTLVRALMLPLYSTLAQLTGP